MMRRISFFFSLLCFAMSVHAVSFSDEALVAWLYDNMSQPDSAAYPREFYLNNVRASLKARQEMPWGASVPEREFLHFVLPVRVNNESLDNSRSVFYEELAPRVKGLSMADAIQEVNHWCHEKVTYRPSDARTSSPLSAVSQAIGRCGEESTFTVAALRSVGIPARQIYTPRWAHTDDNHAWVEAWADGRWYFLGACEPAPVLNMAWFNAPASRGMLMHTDVTGRYDGPEEVIARRPLITTINVTPNYAPVGKSVVHVVDRDGAPVEGADVQFGIYNYAEFYPAVRRKTDAEGNAELLSGIGDMIVWASDGRNFGLTKVNPSMQQPVTLCLDKDEDFTGIIDFDIVPPAASGSLPSPSAEAVAANERRLAYEDSVRQASSSARFIAPQEAASIASELKLPAERLTKVLSLARGNARCIVAYMKTLLAEERSALLSLLELMAEKDLRDAPVPVLADNLDQAMKAADSFEIEYVAVPRVEYERLVPYKEILGKEIPANLARKWRKNPREIMQWAAKNFTPMGEGNPKKMASDPIAVWTSRKADERGRNIFCIAALRSLGVAARLDPVNGAPQYAADRKWHDLIVKSSDSKKVAPAKLPVKLQYTVPKVGSLPKYYYQFAIGAIENGMPATLGFDEVNVEQLNDSLYLSPGQYMLLSGTRLADGTVLARANFFKAKANEDVSPVLTMRNDTTSLSVIGSLNAENIYHDLETASDRSILSKTGRGYYVMALIKPNDEPSTHILNDLSEEKAELEKLGNKLMFLFTDKANADRFNRDAFPNLPSTVSFGIDNEGVSLSELAKSLNLPNRDLPLIVIADTFNRVVYVSQGYTIGTGQRLAAFLHSLR